jgi:hypothetical protein
MSDLAMPHAACRNQCTHCCHIPVAMTAVEAAIIGKQIGVAPKEPDYKVPVGEREYGYQYPCPFLADGGCSIYEHRPLSCRTLLNLDDDELLCRLVPGEAISVPYMDLSQVQAAYIEATFPAPLADIRDFFPNGLKAEPK